MYVANHAEIKFAFACSLRLLPVCESGSGDLATMIQQGLIFLDHLWEAGGKSCEASLHTSIHTS